ncbi:MAG: RNA 3'-terminal phosphate cyclase [Methanocellales archaeon]|nr:RNA 3'-terminal phosphate cyclase [Methanocellales archaeon]
MLEIDGSYGEGGGQIIRTGIALSAVTGRSVYINNIRSKRPKPGLAAQHLEALRCIALLTDADVSGLKLGSTELTFSPKEVKSGEYNIDIGTAGSITLFLQCLMPVAIRIKDPISINIRGGTDVAWSPPMDHLRYVMLPTIAKMGYDAHIDLIRRGYYPRGGGLVKAVIRPSVLSGVVLHREKIEIMGISHCSRLPEHVATRQAASAKEVLAEGEYDAQISTECSQYESTGSGITLWCPGMSGSSLGEKGKPAEEVGRGAAKALLNELRSGASTDVHLADQLIPYMALADGKCSLTTRALTSHARTNIWLVERILDVKFKTEERDLVCIRK